MIVADTSACISLTIGDVFDLVCEEYAVHTTTHVRDELCDTAEYDDVHGHAANEVLEGQVAFEIHDIDAGELHTTSRIDGGEASCLVLTQSHDAAFLLTDDLRALPELQELTDAHVAISPVVLRALVTRDVLSTTEATARLEEIATSRDWLGAPIYRRAQQLFE